MQDGPPSQSRYHAFLLRLFQPEPESPWQIVLKTTDQDQPVLFWDAKELLEFLVMLMETERSVDAQIAAEPVSERRTMAG